MTRESRSYTSPNHPLEEGIRIAAEQVKQAQQLCQGVHLMAVKTEHLIPQILDQAGIRALEPVIV